MSIEFFRVRFPKDSIPPLELAPTEEQSVLDQVLFQLNSKLKAAGEKPWPCVPPGAAVEPPLPGEIEIKHVNRRYYSEPPEAKSLGQCRSHGGDHAAYGWAPEVDPRWTAKQIEAYWEGYNTQRDKNEKRNQNRGLYPA